MRLRLGVMDLANDPPTVIGDPILIFDGKLDQMNWEEDGETARIVVNAESRLIDLERSRESRYTEQEQKRRYAGDTFFDYTAESVNREIVLQR